MSQCAKCAQRPLDSARLAIVAPLFGLLFASACRVGAAFTNHPALRFLATAHVVVAVIDLLALATLDGNASSLHSRNASGWSVQP